MLHSHKSVPGPGGWIRVGRFLHRREEAFVYIEELERKRERYVSENTLMLIYSTPVWWLCVLMLFLFYVHVVYHYHLKAGMATAIKSSLDDVTIKPLVEPDAK